ncbi:MAG: creatininase family protein, partial [Gemmatimonadetes bacterium]|nr:creatininase family protein [Gemmatimonadota bacterium]
MDSGLWGHATWTELEALGLGCRGAGGSTPTPHGSHVVALLPVGAVEAHGPHLPLTTDVIIAAAAPPAPPPGAPPRRPPPQKHPSQDYTPPPQPAGGYR